MTDFDIENIFGDACVVQHGRARRGLPGRLVARRQLGHDQALADREQGVLWPAGCRQGQGGALRVRPGSDGWEAENEQLGLRMVWTLLFGCFEISLALSCWLSARLQAAPGRDCP